MKWECTRCKHETCAPKRKGNGWIELILWLCYIIPGLIYSIWRRGSPANLCPTCGASSLIPTGDNTAAHAKKQSTIGTYVVMAIVIWSCMLALSDANKSILATVADEVRRD